MTFDGSKEVFEVISIKLRGGGQEDLGGDRSYPAPAEVSVSLWSYR